MIINVGRRAGHTTTAAIEIMKKYNTLVIVPNMLMRTPFINAYGKVPMENCKSIDEFRGANILSAIPTDYYHVVVIDCSIGLRTIDVTTIKLIYKDTPILVLG